MWKMGANINMKWYKILFVAWIGIFILAFGGIGVVSLMSQNKTFKAEIHVNNIKKVDDGYLYNVRIKYSNNIFRTQKNISNIDILEIKYDDTINENNITNFTRQNHRITFVNTQTTDLKKIGDITFTVSFSPAIKTFIEYFIYGILIMIGIGIIHSLGSRIKIYKIYDLISNTKYIQEIRNIIMDFVAQHGFVKLLFISSVIYFIALFALLRGNVYYVDDWGRAIWGGGWNAFSRYVATFSYTVINVFKGPSYVDISPIPQFLAIILLSISGLIMSYIIRKKIDLLGVIAAIPLGLSPHYLQNMSYKFDSFTMSLSILFCVIPFLFKDRLKYFGLFSVAGIILSLSTYQASNSVYIVLSMYLAIAMYIFSEKSNVDICKFILTAMLSFIIGMIIYKYLIVSPIASHLDYVSDSAMPISQILKGGNTIAYLKLLHTDLKSLPFFALMIISMFMFMLSMIANSHKKAYVSFVVSIVFLSVGLVLSYGAYLILAKPLFALRAFIGFGGFVSIIMIALLNYTKYQKLYFINAVFVCLIGYSLIVFASAYGNAIAKQQEYIMYRAGFVAKDMANIIDKSKNKKIRIMLKGNIGYSPATQNFINRYGQMASRLIPGIMINSPLFWHTYNPIKYLGVDYGNYYGTDCEKLKDNSNEKLIVSNTYHDISQNGKCYIVELKNYRQ